jgi:hypothetical protein
MRFAATPTVAACETASRVACRAETPMISYLNASTASSPDTPADLASFMLAADPVFVEAAELARVLARAHQGAATQLIGEGWAHAASTSRSR